MTTFQFSASGGELMPISVYRSQMASEGLWDTPSEAILWAIYTDLQGLATRGAELEGGQLTTFQ